MLAGNFDRFSATRRTRRYKRTQDSPGDKDKSDASSPELVCDAEKPQRPNTLALADEDARDEEDAMLRVWQDKLKRRDIASSTTLSRDIDAALAEITRSGEDLQHLSHHSALTAATTTTAVAATTTTTTVTPATHRSSRLPVSQPPPVVAVTNTVLSPVMQESRPREAITVLAERAVTSRERHRSMIDPSQVKEAVRFTSNPPSQVNQEQESSNFSRNGTLQFDRKHERSSVPNTAESGGHTSPKSNDLKRDVQAGDDEPRDRSRQSSMFRSRFIPDINVTSSSLQASSGKGKDQELNDEGFEETQSLVSETLSQETSSGNYETDTHDSTRCSPAELGYHRGIRTMDDDDLDGGKRTDRKPAASKVFDKPRESASTRSTRDKSSFLPKRTSDVHKRESTPRKAESSKRVPNVVRAPSNSAIMRNEVQRSGSRSSLRSSRSSLNSATSVNTVRNLATSHAHLRNYTSAIRALTSDLGKSSPSSSPLPPKDSADKRRPSPRAVGISRIPASRSSSSGSSIGPAARNARKASAVVGPHNLDLNN